MKHNAENDMQTGISLIMFFVAGVPLIVCALSYAKFI